MCVYVVFGVHAVCASTHGFEGVEADIPADVAVLVEPVFGKRAALQAHAQLHKQPHDELVGLRPRLPVLLAVDDVIETL